MMRRISTFEPGRNEVFLEQQQKFDWALLRDSSVFYYKSRSLLVGSTEQLRILNYRIHWLDGIHWNSIDDFMESLTSSLSYQSDMYSNADALQPLLGEIRMFESETLANVRGTVISIENYQHYAEKDPSGSALFLNSFAREARLAGLFAHPMLCLVEADGLGVEPVGGIPVRHGPVWDTTSDDSDLFSGTVKVSLSFYAGIGDEPAAHSIIAATFEQAVHTLDELQALNVGRVEHASERAASMNANNRPSPPPEGEYLAQLEVDVTGSGDLSVFLAAVSSALDTAHFRWEQMGTR